MEKRTLSRAILLGISFVLFMPSQTKTLPSWDEISMKNVAGPLSVGALATALCYGWYKIYKHNVARNVAQRRTQYQSAIDHAKKRIDYSQHFFEHVNIDVCALEVSEKFLETNRVEFSRIQDVEYQVNGLRKIKGILQKYISQLQNMASLEQEDEILLQSMQQTKEEVAEFLSNIEPYYAWLCEHISFIYLSDLQDKLSKLYRYELDAIQTYVHDRLSLAHIIEQSENIYILDGHYKHITYANKLDDIITRLHTLLKKARYKYPECYKSAKQLESYLINVRSIVVEGNAYARELNTYKQDQLLEIQRKLVAAEQAKANALREQNEIERDKLWEMRMDRLRKNLKAFSK